MQLVLFDYNQLDAETRIVVEQRTGEIKALMRRTAQDIIEIGEKLIEVKGRLPHGAFGGWLDSEFDWSQMTATKYMNIAAKFKDTLIIENGSAGIEALALLAAPSTPDEARQEAIERAEAGERITYTKSQDIVSHHKEPQQNGNAHQPQPIPDDNRPLFGKDEHLDAALEDETMPVCQNCGQVYSGQECPSCRPHQFYQTTNARQDVAVTTFSSETNEYYTPAEFIEAARQVMGAIDLDPASCELAQQTVKASDFYTEADDGLAYDWQGRVWLNPPYGKIGNDSSQGQWAQYLIDQYENGNVSEAVLLVKAAVGYEWFEVIWDEYPACFSRRRLSFTKEDGTSDGQSKQGTAFFYLGKNVERFIETFSKFGRVILPENQL